MSPGGSETVMDPTALCERFGVVTMGRSGRGGEPYRSEKALVNSAPRKKIWLE